MWCGCGAWKCSSDDKKLKVNENCIGCGACVAICGDVFDLNDEGIAFVKEGSDNNCACVDDAIWACPVGAIVK